ncbi:HicB_like antitoxin of toxin-antitoxin system [Paenibacillus sophorae]|uniref:HicB_like antitoxin of toxin-antitoxin system n=1 Tax=Paenibacillus sophorae TaxID=1333845 RepID=A0A1H8GEZ8_9BACL|nr:type II toxin-antitoxin system HicB family antitoxin [Paenibacillus sophorae]QWU14201.1 type II toxin-antitoxin system HicB family antitoxin [Paenibacillus sophorae]SEN42543.1 HicB_like antitoxin of toxin-antitoxin system [Paenibacillus sophorae]
MNIEKNYTYVAVLDFNNDHIQISFPDLEEALTQADTLEEAFRRANEVLKLTVQSRLEDGELIPGPTPIEQIKLAMKQFTTIASCTISTKIKYVKKTLTIPEDLNEVAERRGINFSQVLQNAIREKLEED